MKESEFQEEWLSAYLDDELTDEQRQVVEQRLAIDPAAHMMLDDLRRVRAMVAKLPGWSGAGFKFAIPDVLPGATSVDSEGVRDELPDAPVTDRNDFEEVPRAVADTDGAPLPKSAAPESTMSSETVRGTGAAWGGESRGSPRSMMTWFATAASLLLMAGLGYFFWPSGSLVVSQLDRGVGRAAPSNTLNEKAMQSGAASIQQEPSMNTLGASEDASPSEEMFGAAPAADASATGLSTADPKSDFGATSTVKVLDAQVAEAAVSNAKSAMGDLNSEGLERGLPEKEKLSRESRGGIPGSGALRSAVPEILSMQSAEPAASGLPESGARGSSATDLPSTQSAMSRAAILPPNRMAVEERNSNEFADAKRKVADDTLGNVAKSQGDATLDPSGLSANAAQTSRAELPRPVAPQAMADQDATLAERSLLQEQVGLESIKREQAQIVDNLDAANSAPAVIVARSSKWNEDETLQYAATQAPTFYGENALNFRQSGQNLQALQPAVKENQLSEVSAATGNNADVLMATVKTDPVATEALFNSVVISNQFLPVDPQPMATTNQLANPASTILSDTAADKSDLAKPIEPSNLNALGSGAIGSSGANYWYSPMQRGRAAPNGPLGNSLMLFVTREEANRILKELQEQGQVTSPVWRVVQRSEAGAQNTVGSQTRGSSEAQTRTAVNPPDVALNSPSEQPKTSLSRQLASPTRSQNLGTSPAESRNAPSQAPAPAAAGQSTAIPAPADSDKVILMLNGSPQ